MNFGLYANMLGVLRQSKLLFTWKNFQKVWASKAVNQL